MALASLPWTKGKSGGNSHCLFSKDYMTLQETIEEKAHIDRAYDTYSILDEAYKIKLIRIEKTVQVLHLFNSERFIKASNKNSYKKQQDNGLIREISQSACIEEIRNS